MNCVPLDGMAATSALGRVSAAGAAARAGALVAGAAKGAGDGVAAGALATVVVGVVDTGITNHADLQGKILSGKLAPEKLIGRTINLEQSIDVLMNMDKFEVAGVTVVTEF